MPARQTMQEYTTSLGKPAGEVLVAAGACYTSGAVAARFVVKDFRRLCDENGHVINIELPGQLCGFLRARAGCRYSEIVRTAHLSDAVILGIFNGGTVFQNAVAALGSHVFQLDYLTLPCPTIDIHRGPLDRLLQSYL
jgi:hypothetical protein